MVLNEVWVCLRRVLVVRYILPCGLIVFVRQRVCSRLVVSTNASKRKLKVSLNDPANKHPAIWCWSLP